MSAADRSGSNWLNLATELWEPLAATRNLAQEQAAGTMLATLATSTSLSVIDAPLASYRDRNWTPAATALPGATGSADPLLQGPTAMAPADVQADGTSGADLSSGLWSPGLQDGSAVGGMASGDLAGAQSHRQSSVSETPLAASPETVGTLAAPAQIGSGSVAAVGDDADGQLVDGSTSEMAQGIVVPLALAKADPAASRALSNPTIANIPLASPSPYESEIAFISNVTAAGLVAGTSFESWSYAGAANPATYSAGYSFATKQGSLTPGSAGGTIYYYFDPGSSWTSTEKAGLASGLALWSSEVNISFQQTSTASQADLTFERGAANTGAFQYFPNATLASVGASTEGAPGTGAYISIDTTAYGYGSIGGSFSYAGGYSYDTLVHEEGHFLGLGHGGPYDGDVTSATQQFSAYDTRLWDLMSYIEPSDTSAKYYSSYTITGTSWQGNDPTTPMIVDILAAQRLYGAATTGDLTRAETFGFHTTLTGAEKNYFDFTVNSSPVITIWDSASGNTLDLSGYSQDAVINLNPDSFCSCDGMVNNVAIADGTRINNAVGGSGSDLFILNPSLSGTFTGDGGNDTFQSTFAGLNADTITDFNAGDTIHVTDATLSSLSAAYNSQTGLLTLMQGGHAQTLILPSGLSGVVRSADAGGGVDLTVGVPPKTVRDDFNGDGRSDLMWQDRSSGGLYEWAMSGSQAGTGSGYVASLDPATWQPLSAGDFNGDGKADLLWQDTSGNLIDWAMDGTQVTSGAYVGTMPGSQYGLLATDDFNSDGKADLLWQDKSTGALSLWDMNGAQVSGGGYVANMDPSTWQLAAHGDFSGDGKADLLWENRSTGDLYLWDMNDRTVTGSAYVGTMNPSQWNLAASGDFNGDGKADLLWQDKGTGNLFSWDMNNAQVGGGGYVGTMNTSQWSVAGTGDFTGDGKTDLLWQDASGNMLEWAMNDAQVSGGGYVGTMNANQWLLAA